jgi:putative resolvase
MEVFKPHEFAEKIGVTVLTLQRWDNNGSFPARRTPMGRRYYTEEDLKKYFRQEDKDNGKT